MKTRNVLIALAAVAMFAVPVMAQTGDECTAGDVLSSGDVVNPCNLTANAADPMQCPQGGGPTGCTGCWSSDGADGNVSAWYSFSATATSMRVRTDLGPQDGGDDHIAVFSGSCGSLTAVPGACGEDTPTDANAACCTNDICAAGLTVGDTYFVQMGVWSAGACNDYRLDVTEHPDGSLCGNGDIDGACEACDGSEIGD